MTEVGPSIEGPRATLLMRIGAWLAVLVLLAATAGAVVWLLQGFQTFQTILAEEPERMIEVEPVVEPVVAPTSPFPDKDGHFIVNPSWARAPRPAFPARAAKARIEQGKAVLDCRVKIDGRVTDCAVTETPAGYGFGEAALLAAGEARLQPRMVDGEPTEARIRFNTRFQLE